MTLHDVLVPVVSALVLVLPGLVLALLAELRPGTAVAVAPVLTYGVVTLAATVASAVAFPWQPWTLVLATLLVGAGVVGLRLLTGRRLPWHRRVEVERLSHPGWRELVVIAGVLTGGVLAAAVLRDGFGRLDTPNQDWDYVFHSSAVRLIADSGDLAPAAMARINDWESTSFYYPNTFHGVAAVVRDLTGGTVFEVLNSQSMIVCLVAGLGLAGLLHRLRAPLPVAAVTPVLLAGFAAFPYDVLWRGPLLPYAAGVAVVPAFVLLLDVVLDLHRTAPTLLFALGAAGLLGLHPSTALSAALFVLVWLVVRWWRSPSSIGGDLVILAAGGVSALVIAAPAVLGAVATSSAGADVDWPAIESPGQAVGDLLLVNHELPAPQLWLGVLVLVGLLTVHRAGYMWAWLAGAVVPFVLFVMAASSDDQLVADLTRPWWNDRWRFAALVVLGLAPLAAHALWTVARTLALAVRRRLGGRVAAVRGPAPACVLVLAGLLLLVVLTEGLYAPLNSTRVAGNYQRDDMLDHDEITAMRWLADHSTGGSVMNDANDGSAYLSAVTGLHPLFGHIVEPRLIPRMGPTQQLLVEHFNCLDSDPAVRRAIEDLDIRYVFLGSGYIRPDYTRLPGLRGIDGSPSLELVHREPGVRVFAVHLTDSPSAPVPACLPPGDDNGTDDAEG
ncbi:DUF6541 family protein [Geodermatophilus sp. URMC 62]|uniref:DUF6541 family protein n=1 Tax=Geodermatophilus sp. URMC 62 TaxID=3423414 RepID=UPI00406CB6A8